ncbi:hypothetical protein ACH0C8_15540, partial [Acetobacter lovaniensis]|uniref:hypothetical protein n=1 Tax=Acetobacter lovaniensis TaxID=104100 RepID=UPI0037700A41
MQKKEIDRLLSAAFQAVKDGKEAEKPKSEEDLKAECQLYQKKLNMARHEVTSILAALQDKTNSRFQYEWDTKAYEIKTNIP